MTSLASAPVGLSVEAELDSLVCAIRLKMNRTLELLIEVGQDLLRAKELVPHGEWGNWLQSQFGWSHSTALNFMRVAETFGDQVENLNGCDFAPKLLYTLAAPSTSDTVRNIAVFEGQQAEVSVDRVKELKAHDGHGPMATYLGDACFSLNGEVQLSNGDACVLTGNTFIHDPSRIYVEAQGQTFLVPRNSVVGEAGETLDAPRSVNTELANQAESLGLPTSPKQVLPDSNRDHLHTSPHDVDDRPGAEPLNLTSPEVFAVGDKVVIRGCLASAQRDPKGVGIVRQVLSLEGALKVDFPGKGMVGFTQSMERFERFVESHKPAIPDLDLHINGIGGIRIKGCDSLHLLEDVCAALHAHGMEAEISSRYI